MGDISTTITVDVTGAGDLSALAAAANDAAEALDRLEETAGRGLDFSGAGAGAGKFAEAWEGALGKVEAQIDGLNKQLADIGKAGAAGGDAGAAALADSWGAAADDVSASVDKIAADTGKLGEVSAGTASAAGEVGKLGDAFDATASSAGKLKDTLPAVGDGIKGLGGSGDEATAQLAALRAEMKATAEQNDKLMASMAASADTTVTAAKASAIYAEALPSLGTASIEQDAAVRQGALARSAASKQAAADAEQAAAAQESSAQKYHMLALGGAAALGYGIYKAAQLQTAVTRLYTTAGESAKNLPSDAAGILKLSGQTNTSQAQLGQGAYMISSAGFHGQNMLGVLKAAAEGAQAEGAPLGDTANALTSLMNAYGVPKGQSASQAAMSDMDQIISMVSRGKMTMASAVSALPSVLPAASAAKLSFADVGGALSTMTSMGVSPDRAAENLSHVITSIMNPSAVQTKEQQQLGLNPVQLQNDLGKQGLTGTLSELSGTVMKSMGPAGDVLFKTFNQSKSAAADANTMISAMPASLQKVAQAYADGKTTAKEWTQEVYSGSESAQQKNLLEQFATVENQSRGFNDLLKSGSPAVQTYAAAMDKLLGGQTGLNVAMELTGQHMPVMKANTDAIAASAQQAGANVQGWSAVTKTLNFQLGSFEKQAEAVATQAGQVALPAVTELMKGLGAVTGFLAANPALTKPLLETGGAFAAAAMLPKLASVGSTALASVGKVGSVLGVPGAEKLAGIGSGATPGAAAASSGLTGVASAADAAAGALNGVAGAGAKAAAGEDAVGAAGGKAALEEGTAGAEGAAGAGKAGAGAVLTTAAIGVILSKALIDSVESKKNPAVLGSTNPDSAWNKWPTPGDHDNSIAGEVVSGWGKGTGLATEEQTPQFESRFGIPAPPASTAPSGATTASGASATALRDMTQIDAAMKAGKPVKVPAPDLSAVAGAKGQAAADANGITQAIAQAMSKPVKMAPPDLSALSAAAGKATAAGASVASGFAAGIASGAGAAAAAGASLANAATGAMMHTLDSRSPSKVTEKIGTDTGTGYAQGISASKSKVDSAAASIGSDSVTSLIQGLQGGQDAMQAATTALAGAAANPDAVTTIQQTIASLTADVPAGEDTGLVKWLGQQQTKLTALANKQGALEAEISDAGQLATSAIGGASITSAATYTPALAASNGPQAAQSIVTGMQQQMQDTQAFAGQLTQLQKMGLNATSLSQLAQAGTATGLPLAEGLAQGGKGAIAQLNQYEKQIVSASQQIGTVGGVAMYQAGQQVTAGLAASLKDQLKQVDKVMTTEANAVIAKVQKALGTGAASSSSASTAASAGSEASAASGSVAGAVSASGGLGKIGSAAGGAASGLSSVASAAPGAASGLSAVASAASGAAGALAKATSPSGGGTSGMRGGGGYGGSSGGGGVTVHSETHVHVQGNVTAEQDLATTIQGIVVERSANNWQTGWRYPGRPA